jgi:hypothetical protein
MVRQEWFSRKPVVDSSIAFAMPANLYSKILRASVAFCLSATTDRTQSPAGTTDSFKKLDGHDWEMDRGDGRRWSEPATHLAGRQDAHTPRFTNRRCLRKKSYGYGTYLATFPASDIRAERDWTHQQQNGVHNDDLHMLPLKATTASVPFEGRYPMTGTGRLIARRVRHGFQIVPVYDISLRQ